MSAPVAATMTPLNDPQCKMFKNTKINMSMNNGADNMRMRIAHVHFANVNSRPAATMIPDSMIMIETLNVINDINDYGFR